MKRINTILWSEEPPENTNTLWLNDGILYYYNDGWEAISDISKYIESLAKSADRITAASNKIFSVNNMLSNNADLIGSNVQKLESSSDSISQSTEILATVSQQLTDSAEDVINGVNTIKNSTDALQTNADKVGASATAVEQAVEPLVQASESLDATKQAFEMLSSEWADGRQAIATALTNRRYPTEPTESFHAMADKITNMSYEEGWFAKIGYTDDNASALKEMIDYSYELAKGWNPDGSTPNLFENDANLVFFPMVDTSNQRTAARMFYGTSKLIMLPNLSFPFVEHADYMLTSSGVSRVGDIDLPNAISTHGMVSQASRLTHIGAINCPKATDMHFTFNSSPSIKYIKSVDVGSAISMNAFMTTGVQYAVLKNLGKSTLTTYNFSNATAWGTGSEENRQSLIDSLITYSYDRASAGMPTATITLSANTKALLTEEEIAQITAKGFTIA